ERPPNGNLLVEGAVPAPRCADAELGVILADVQTGASLMNHFHDRHLSGIRHPAGCRMPSRVAVTGRAGQYLESDVRAQRRHSTVPVAGPPTPGSCSGLTSSTKSSSESTVTARPR